MNIHVAPETFEIAPGGAMPTFELTVGDDDRISTTLDEPERRLALLVDGLENADFERDKGGGKVSVVDDDLLKGETLLLVAHTDELRRLTNDAGKDPAQDLLRQFFENRKAEQLESKFVAGGPWLLGVPRAPADEKLKNIRAIRQQPDWELPDENEAFNKFDIASVLKAALLVEQRVTSLRGPKQPLNVILIYPHNYRDGKSNGLDDLQAPPVAAGLLMRRLLIYPAHPAQRTLISGSESAQLFKDFVGDARRVEVLDLSNSEGAQRVLGGWVKKPFDEF